MKKTLLIKRVLIFFVGIFVFYIILNYLFFSGETQKKSKATDESIVSLLFDPNNITVSKNNDFSFSLKIKANSGSFALRGYAIDFTYDKTKIQLKKIEYKIGVPSPELGATDNDISNINSSGSGFFRIVGEVDSPTGQIVDTNQLEIAKLTFNFSGDSGTTIKTLSRFYTINSDNSLKENIINDPKNININGGGEIISPPIALSPGVSPKGNTILSLKLKFQGITKKPSINDVMNVKVKISGCNLSSPKETIGSFKADDNGVWSGSVGFDLTSCANYILYIKGPHHLQKKICDSSPSESSFGTYRCSQGGLNIKTGENNFDFSKILLLVGDLDQNGITDSVDISIIRNNLGKTDQSILSKADLNHDGRIDTQDFSLVIAALSVKVDEM